MRSTVASDGPPVAMPPPMRLRRVMLGSFGLSSVHCLWWGGPFRIELEWIAYWLVLASFWFAAGVGWTCWRAAGREPPIPVARAISAGGARSPRAWRSPSRSAGS